MSLAAYRFGLIGWPVAHSFSPALHRAAMYAAGVAGTYELIPVPAGPQAAQDLESQLDRMRRGDLQGLNVTIPHKAQVASMVEALTPAGSAIGAVNTVYFEDGKLRGDNTDAPGFLADLAHLVGGPPGQALVLGAGGSARAVAFALVSQGWRVAVAARRLGQAQQLVSELSSNVDGLTAVGKMDALLQSLELAPEALAAIIPRCSLLVNCTPVGMAPDSQASPWPAETPFARGLAVYDLVYNPSETALLRSARAAGLPARPGLGMLVEQAALSFERWTGLEAARAAMWAALEQSTGPGERTGLQ